MTIEELSKIHDDFIKEFGRPLKKLILSVEDFEKARSQFQEVQHIKNNVGEAVCVDFRFRGLPVFYSEKLAPGEMCEVYEKEETRIVRIDVTPPTEREVKP